MSDQANDENINVLLTSLMRSRYCSKEVNELDACLENSIPSNINNSYVDQSLYRRGIRQCAKYSEVAKKCMNNEERQQAIFAAAVKVPACRNEVKALQRCKRVSGRDCNRELLEAIYCGMVFLVKRERQRHDGGNISPEESKALGRKGKNANT